MSRSTVGQEEEISGLGYLKHLVKADLQQGIEDNVDIVQIMKLPVESGLGQGHAVLKPGEDIQLIAHGFDGLVGTDADALTAVDTPVGQNGGLAATDTDGFGGTALDAGGTAAAASAVQYHGMPHSHVPVSPRFAVETLITGGS